ncbi:hypothetical protein EUX98_g5084 [Antrodiella citrinella]|uniref:Uncharacterized protein n=1 Tax=Antrodiella citrinella TaxID=2447956 RepID=A0A4S4MSG0_9APHY|nr:hypothetical protein EUX98_g5084 [Antrodiella citrinella]
MESPPSELSSAPSAIGDKHEFRWASLFVEGIKHRHGEPLLDLTTVYNVEELYNMRRHWPTGTIHRMRTGSWFAVNRYQEKASGWEVVRVNACVPDTEPEYLICDAQMAFMRLFCWRYSVVREILTLVTWPDEGEPGWDELADTLRMVMVTGEYMMAVRDAIEREMDTGFQIRFKNDEEIFPEVEGKRLMTLDAWLAREIRTKGDIENTIAIAPEEKREQESGTSPVLEKIEGLREYLASGFIADDGWNESKHWQEAEGKVFFAQWGASLCQAYRVGYVDPNYSNNDVDEGVKEAGDDTVKCADFDNRDHRRWREVVPCQQGLKNIGPPCSAGLLSFREGVKTIVQQAKKKSRDKEDEEKVEEAGDKPPASSNSSGHGHRDVLCQTYFLAKTILSDVSGTSAAACTICSTFNTSWEFQV